MTRRAYYNDNSPDAAAWLRELIAAGLIMAGDVDERSIVDVRPADLKGFTRHHFFAGVAGWELALQLADWPDDRPVATASLPCQPFSNAGKRQGVKDERHLWPVFAELVRECGFATIFGEQVESAIRHGWLDGVFADLEQLGYACAAGCLPAACVGAPHIRQRVFWLANAQGRGGQPDAGTVHGLQERARCEQHIVASSGGEAGGLAESASPRCYDAGQHGSGPSPLPARPVECGGTGGLADAERAYSRGGIAGEQGQPGFGRAGLADDGEAGGLGNAAAGGRGIGGDEAQPGSGGHALGTGGAGLGGLEHAASERAINGGQAIPGSNGTDNGVSGAASPWSDFILIPCRDGRARRTQSGLSPLAYGLPRDVAMLMPRLAKLGHDPTAARQIIREARRHRITALKGAGNSICVPLAAEFIRAAMEAMKEPA